MTLKGSRQQRTRVYGSIVGSQQKRPRVYGSIVIVSACLLSAIATACCDASAEILDKTPATESASRNTKTNPKAKATNQKFAGIVLNSYGSWNVEINGKKRSIGAGEEIPYGGILNFRSENATIEIWLCDNQILKYPDKKDIVGVALKPLEPKDERKFWLKVVIDFLTAPNGPAFTPMVRGSISGLMEDGVVALRDDSIDLNPIFTDEYKKKETSTFISLKKIDCNGSTRSSPKFGPIELRPSSSSELATTIAVPGIEPGAYEVVLLDESRSHRPTDASIWVLVVGQKEHEVTSNQYQLARADLRECNSMPANKKIRLLRAFLLSSAMSLNAN